MIVQDIKPGAVVGTVDLDQLRGPLEVPALPQRWFILRVHPHREFKVLKTFQQRNISGWLPIESSMQDVIIHRRGYQVTRKKLITSPLVSGCLIVPDFEVVGERWRSVDGIIGIYRMGPCVPVLTPELYAQLRMIEKIRNTPNSKRAHKFAVGDLVRVTSGPFAQFCGLVERVDSRSRLSVGVDIFGRITPVEIEPGDVEAVPAAHVAARVSIGRKKPKRRSFNLKGRC
jgi:transcriptional antiterminator NusG